MRRGDKLLIAVAIGIVALITLGTGAYFGTLYATRINYDAAERVNATHIRHDRPSQIDRDRAGLPYAVEQVTAGPDPKDNVERENRDLAAQESTSVWTFWMAVISSLGVVTTMVGTAFLLWQITLTRRAVADTSEATAAMLESNRIAELTQRPWIDVSLDTLSARIVVNRLAVECEISIGNVGNSIANKVSVELHALRFPYYTIDRDNLLYGSTQPSKIYETYFLVPNTTVVLRRWLFPAFSPHQVLPEIDTDEMRIHAAVVVRYQKPDRSICKAGYVFSISPDGKQYAAIQKGTSRTKLDLRAAPIGCFFAD